MSLPLLFRFPSYGSGNGDDLAISTGGDQGNPADGAGGGVADGTSRERGPVQKANAASHSRDYFDTKAFCVTLSWGLILATPVMVTRWVFHELPIITIVGLEPMSLS